MKPIKDLRREHLEFLSEKYGGQSALAALIKRDRNQVYQWLLPPESPASRGIGDKMARHIESSLFMEPGALDNIMWLSADDHRLLSSPVSPSDATSRDSRQTGIRRVRIEGAVVMEENGFWRVGDIEADEAPYPTDDPEAYAIRVTSQRFQPVVALAQCILVSPRTPLKPGRPVVVTTRDGRKTLRTYLSHESGVWNLTSVNNANDYLDLAETEVTKVERVMAYLWTD